MQVKQSSLVINPLGGAIETLILNGKEILKRVNRIDGKSAATHLCSPNFRTICGNFSLPQHGPVRNQMWESIVSQEKIIITTYVKSDHTPNSYPDGLYIEQEHTLNEHSYTCTTTHYNKGIVTLSVNSAMHCYFATNKTWEGLTINNKIMDKEVKETLFIPIQDTFTIDLPHKPTILLSNTGYSYAMLWTGRNENKFDMSYVCIEPVEFNPDTGFMSHEAFIKPHYCRTTSFTISV